MYVCIYVHTYICTHEFVTISLFIILNSYRVVIKSGFNFDEIFTILAPLTMGRVPDMLD